MPREVPVVYETADRLLSGACRVTPTYARLYGGVCMVLELPYASFHITHPVYDPDQSLRDWLMRFRHNGVRHRSWIELGYSEPDLHQLIHDVQVLERMAGHETSTSSIRGKPRKTEDGPAADPADTPAERSA